MNCTVFVPVPWEKATSALLIELMEHFNFSSCTYVTKDGIQGLRMRF